MGILNATARLAPSPDALAREIDGEVLLLDLRSSEYFGLPGTGAEVWALIEERKTVTEIADTLASRYPDDAEAVRRDVHELVDALAAARLIETAGG